MSKSIDIQRKLKEQLDSLDELSNININIDELLKNLKSATEKYIVKNQRNIQRLLDVQGGLKKLLGQQHASLGSLEDSLNDMFAILSDLTSFSRTIERVNKAVIKTNQTLSKINLDSLKDFDVNVVIDFFGEVNRNFSVTKMNKLSKYISSISLDGLYVVTDDLKKFDMNIITNFLGTINKLFGENRLNKVVSKISKTSGTEDFQIVMMYLKDMDKFLSDSISYLNKMTNRIKNFVNKTNVNAGGTPSKVGGGGGGDKGMFGRLLFAGAGIAFLNQQFPALTRMVGMIAFIGKAFVDAGTKTFQGLSQIVKGFGDVKMMGGGLVKMLGGVALGFGIVVGILVMGIKKLLQGIEEAQRMRLEAARESGLNELAFMGTSASGNVTPGGILSRFAGAGEERMIGARAQMLARMGGNQRLGGMNNSQTKGMAVMSQLFGLTLDKTAQLRDIMENIMDMNFEEKSISFINKYGVLANKVVKDIAENTQEYVLYGAESFERLSSLANKLSVSTKDAIKIIEKFSTVSGAIDTSFNVTLATGKFMNPLTQFMRYAFGDPDEIFKEVIESVGDISSMNRIQQKFLAQSLGMSVDELVVATERFKKIQQVGEEQYNQQYKTLDQIVQSYGFQRLLGGISEILDMLEQEVMRGYFQNALEWIKKNGAEIPQLIEDIASFIRDKVIPVIIDVFTTIGKGIINILGSPLIPSGISASEAENISRMIDSFSTTIKGFTGNNSDRVDDAFITNGRLIKTNSRDTAVFAQTPEGLVSNAIRAASSMGGISGGNNITSNQSSGDRIKILEVKSDVQLDGYKVGEGLTRVALEYTQ